MQNLLTDFHPEFTVSEESFITDFDLDTNGYDFAVGPRCGVNLAVDTASADTLDPLDMTIRDNEGGVDMHCIVTAPPATETSDRYSAMAERCCFEDYDKKLRRYNQFPNTVRIKKYDEDAFDDLPLHIGIKKSARLAVRFDNRR